MYTLSTMSIFTKVLDRAFTDYLVGFLSDLYSIQITEEADRIVSESSVKNFCKY